MKILFVCQGNVARSQIAEAYYNNFTNSNNAFSAGVLHYTPLKYGHPAQEVVELMKEEGMDVSKNKVKFITKKMVEDSDKIFVMREKEECPDFLLNSNKLIFWDIDDPFNLSLDEYKKIRDAIKEKVLSIL